MTNEQTFHPDPTDAQADLWFCSVWAYQDLAAWPLLTQAASEALALHGITLVEDADQENGCWLVSVEPELDEKLNLGLQVEITHRLTDGTRVEIQIHSDTEPSDPS